MHTRGGPKFPTLRPTIHSPVVSRALAPQLKQGLISPPVGRLRSPKANSLSYYDTLFRLIPGTTTNDSAAAGFLGETKSCAVSTASNTVTISNASPGVISLTAHGKSAASVVRFTTTGGLPTGLAVGTNYYVCAGATLLTDSFTVATTIDNAIAGTGINTSSAGSGTQTCISNALLATNTVADIAGLSLTAGDWDVRAQFAFDGDGTTSITEYRGGVGAATATIPTPGVIGQTRFLQTMAAVIPAASSIQAFCTNGFRVSLSGTATYYMSVRATFTVSTLVANGYVEARRIR